MATRCRSPALPHPSRKFLRNEWAEDADRRRAARVPEAVAFTTKPKLGLAMLERAREAGVPFSWITGDSVYGADHTIRRWAEQPKVPAAQLLEWLRRGNGIGAATCWPSPLGRGWGCDLDQEAAQKELATAQRGRRRQGSAPLRLGETCRRFRPA